MRASEPSASNPVRWKRPGAWRRKLPKNCVADPSGEFPRSALGELMAQARFFSQDRKAHQDHCQPLQVSAPLRNPSPRPRRCETMLIAGAGRIMVAAHEPQREACHKESVAPGNSFAAAAQTHWAGTIAPRA